MMVKQKVQIEWVPVSVELPEYTNRAGRSSFIMVLTNHTELGVNETMYSDGKFYDPLLVSLPELSDELSDDIKFKYHKGVTHWSYKPESPKKINNITWIND